MKIVLIFCLGLLLSCKISNEKEDFNELINDEIINQDDENLNLFNKTNFSDRADELIYIREYLKYKLPSIIIEKNPDLAKKAQYELISDGENPTLIEATKRTLTYQNKYDGYMSLIISENMSFKEVKYQLESKGKIDFKLALGRKINNENNYNNDSGRVNDDSTKDNSNVNNNTQEALKNLLKTHENIISEKAEEINSNGRKIIYRPNPEYNCNEGGRVILKVAVNKDGNVTKVYNGYVKGTTNTSKCLFDACRESALKTKWESKDDVANEQIGTLEYNFKLE